MEMIVGHDALFCASDDRIDKEVLDRAGEQLYIVCNQLATTI